jgi:hypothetical protein
MKFTRSCSFKVIWPTLFFANLRALSRCRNVCVVLIGGENMPFIMDRQGGSKIK